LREKYLLTQEYLNDKNVPRGDDNWYKYCGIVINKMHIMYPESKKYSSKFLVAHIVESLTYEMKLELINYLYLLETLEEGSFDWLVKSYFDKISLKTKHDNFIILYNLNKLIILKLENSGDDDSLKWVELDPEERYEFSKNNDILDSLNFDKKNYNKTIGFLGYDKQNTNIVFKTKNLNSSRDTGARCDEAGKKNTIINVNEIIGEEIFTTENTKLIKDKNIVVKEAVSQIELCVLQEFILRYFNEIEKNNLKWFLTPELALYHKLYKIK
jgi:hypothetical protein